MNRFRTTLPWAVVAALAVTCLVSFTVLTFDPADQGTPPPGPNAAVTAGTRTASPTSEPTGEPSTTPAPTEATGPSPDPSGTTSPGPTSTASGRIVVPLPPSPTSMPTSSPGPSPGQTPGQTPVLPPTTRRASPYCLPMPSVTALKVLTFNIHAGVGRGGLDLARVASEIRASGADVVLLQEVDRFRPRSGGLDTPAVLASELGMYQAFAANLSWRSGGGEPQQYGLATLSRFPITEAEHHTLPNRPGREQRGVLRARVDVQGHEVDVFNTHLEHTSSELRDLQAQAVQQVVGASAPLPVVIGGDFNAGPGSPTYRTMTATLSDAWSRVGVGPGLTVPALVPRARIDFLFVTEALVPTAARVVQSAVSDHRAVGVDLLLATATRCEWVDAL